jgi:hypothetical protein
MTHSIRLTTTSNWQSISVAEAMNKYRGMIAPDELHKDCVTVWIYKPEQPVVLWIQELENGYFFTIAGRDSAVGNFAICVQLIADNI